MTGPSPAGQLPDAPDAAPGDSAGTAATVLILGGTGEARELAGLLRGQPGLAVVSSLAGRVRRPALPEGEVRIGGFGGVTGLAAWLLTTRSCRGGRDPPVRRDDQRERGGSVREDRHAAAEAGPRAVDGAAGRPVARGQLAARGGRLLASLGRRAFLTTGRQGLAAFAGLDELWFLIRCVDPPAGPLPAGTRSSWRAARTTPRPSRS